MNCPRCTQCGRLVKNRALAELIFYRPGDVEVWLHHRCKPAYNDDVPPGMAPEDPHA